MTNEQLVRRVLVVVFAVCFGFCASFLFISAIAGN